MCVCGVCRRFNMYIHTCLVTSMISQSSPILLEISVGCRRIEGEDGWYCGAETVLYLHQH